MALADTLKTLVGTPAEQKVPGGDYMLAVSRALRHYSAARGRQEVRTWTTIANQPYYTYDTAAIAKIVDVLPTPIGGTYGGLAQGGYEEFPLAPGVTYTFPAPGSRDGYLRAIAVTDYRQTTGFIWEDRGGQIWIEPPPSADGETLYYLARLLMTEQQVPQIDQELVLLDGQAEVLDMQLKRMLLQPMAVAPGQQISYGMTIRHLRETITHLRRDFDMRTALPSGGH